MSRAGEYAIHAVAGMALGAIIFGLATIGAVLLNAVSP